MDIPDVEQENAEKNSTMSKQRRLCCLFVLFECSVTRGNRRRSCRVNGTWPILHAAVRRRGGNDEKKIIDDGRDVTVRNEVRVGQLIEIFDAGCRWLNLGAELRVVLIYYRGM